MEFNLRVFPAFALFLIYFLPNNLPQVILGFSGPIFFYLLISFPFVAKSTAFSLRTEKPLWQLTPPAPSTLTPETKSLRDRLLAIHSPASGTSPE